MVTTTRRHWHCPTCDHCISGHELVLLDGALVLGCLDCDEFGNVCPAEAFHSTRNETLASLHLQSMHDYLKAGI